MWDSAQITSLRICLCYAKWKDWETIKRILKEQMTWKPIQYRISGGKNKPNTREEPRSQMFITFGNLKAADSWQEQILDKVGMENLSAG